MKTSLTLTAVLVTALTLPGAAMAQTAPETGAAAGATTGAIGGAIVGGPVGAVVGAAAGALIGGLSAEQTAQVQQYVVLQNAPSVTAQESPVAGTARPATIPTYEVPAEVVGEAGHQYTVVNEQPVLVDRRTRRIVRVLK